MVKKYALGADVGGTSVKLGLFGADGALLDKWSIPTNTDDHGKRVLPDVADSIRQVLKKHSVLLDEVIGLGVGVPGPVDAGGTVYDCVNLGWSTVNVPGVVRTLLPEIYHVRAANDANAAALGELRFGSGKGYGSAVTVTLGTGVGSGVALDGRILPGRNGAAGEVGHMTVDPTETEKCNCGKRGCLEQYASATGLVRTAKKLLSASDKTSGLRGLTDFTAKDVCDLARRGDPLCLSAVDRCAEAIGRALSFVACTIDPEVFILGGGLARAGDVLFAPIRIYYAAYAFAPSRDTPIVPAALGNDAGIFGCAGMILEDG